MKSIEEIDKRLKEIGLEVIALRKERKRLLRQSHKPKPRRSILGVQP
jgi:hypothetical protein